jgi:hypothetical protein
MLIAQVRVVRQRDSEALLGLRRCWHYGDWSGVLRICIVIKLSSTKMLTRRVSFSAFIFEITF